MKGGFRKGSGRKKGSIPWNKGVPMSEKSKKKVSESKKGSVPWNKGVPMREDTKLLQAKAHKGKQLWPNGRIFSEQMRKNMGDAKRGKPSGYKGTKESLELRTRRSLSRRDYLARIDFKYSFEPRHILARDRKEVRRQRMKKNGGFHSEEEWRNLKIKHNLTCPSCKKIEPEITLTRDHIIPISCGGTDDIENIQPLCKNCNPSKGTQTIKY